MPRMRLQARTPFPHHTAVPSYNITGMLPSLANVVPPQRVLSPTRRLDVHPGVDPWKVFILHNDESPCPWPRDTCLGHDGNSSRSHFQPRGAASLLSELVLRKLYRLVSATSLLSFELLPGALKCDAYPQPMLKRRLCAGALSSRLVSSETLRYHIFI